MESTNFLHNHRLTAAFDARHSNATSSGTHKAHGSTNACECIATKQLPAKHISFNNVLLTSAFQLGVVMNRSSFQSYVAGIYKNACSALVLRDSAAVSPLSLMSTAETGSGAMLLLAAYDGALSPTFTLQRQSILRKRRIATYRRCKCTSIEARRGVVLKRQMSQSHDAINTRRTCRTMQNHASSSTRNTPTPGTTADITNLLVDVLRAAALLDAMVMGTKKVVVTEASTVVLVLLVVEGEADVD